MVSFDWESCFEIFLFFYFGCWCLFIIDRVNSILRRSLFSAPRKHESRCEQCAKKIQLIAIQLGRKGEKKDLGFDFFYPCGVSWRLRRDIFLLGMRNTSEFSECLVSVLSAEHILTLGVLRRGASVRGDALCLRGVTASETGWQWRRPSAAETDRGTARLSALFSFFSFFFFSFFIYGFEFKLFLGLKRWAERAAVTFIGAFNFGSCLTD